MAGEAARQNSRGWQFPFEELAEGLSTASFTSNAAQYHGFVNRIGLRSYGIEDQRLRLEAPWSE